MGGTVPRVPASVRCYGGAGMITVEIAEKNVEFQSAKAAGVWVAAFISEFGFSEFYVRFSEDCDLEWTDPDLFMEWADIDYFIDVQVPEAFVRKVFINWQCFVSVLRGCPLSGGRVSPKSGRVADGGFRSSECGTAEVRKLGADHE